MKRILYSCLFFVTLCITGSLKAQNYTITPNPQCPINGSAGTYTARVEITTHNAAVNIPGNLGSYSWTVIGPCGTQTANTPPTVAGQPPGTAINVTTSCCGDFTVICNAFNNGGIAVAPNPTPNTQPIFNPNGIPGMIFLSIPCPNSGSITPSTASACANSSTNITALLGATSLTWSTGGVWTTAAGIPSIAVSPSVNTCYSYSATLAYPTATMGTGQIISGATCAITPTNQSCVQVQALTATLSPASQTMCAGSPVSFTALTSATGTNNTPGTTITSYSWVPPAPILSFTTSTNATTAPATAGVYTVYIFHNGAAGSCVTQATANVVIGTSVSVGFAPTSPSICPGSAITITAITAPTTAASYSWTQQAHSTGPPNPIVNIGTGNPKTTILAGPAANFPYTLTVNMDYGGCPGTGTIEVNILTLTPTLSVKSTSVCPNTALTMTATGGVTYTFSAIPAIGASVSPLPVTSGSMSTYTVGNSSTLPTQFCVLTNSTGCTGTTCIVVTERTLFPSLSLSSTSVISSGSVCPLTQFTLSAHGVGSATPATTYTFTSPFGPSTIGTSGQTNSFVTYIPASTVMPSNYTVSVDSAGCKGISTATVNLLTMKPQLSVSAPSVCPGTEVIVTSTNTGSGTTYTFMAPTYTTGPTFTVFGVPGTSVNTMGHEPAFSGTNISITYTVAVDSVGCKGTGTVTVGKLNLGTGLLTLSATALSSRNGSVCPSNAFTIQTSGADSYTLVAPGSPTSIVASGAPPSANAPWDISLVSPSALSAGATYTVYGDSLSCVGQQTFTLREMKLHPSISISPTLVCANQTIAITASLSPASSANGVITPSVNYTFYGSTVPSTTQSPLGPASSSFATVHSPSAVTVYSVSVDSSGCTGVTPGPTVSIAIRPALALVASASSASVCPGLTSTLSVIGPTYATSAIFTWTAPVNGGSLNPSNPAIADTVVAYPIVPTNYTVYAVDSLGCVGSATVDVGIDPGLSFPLSLASDGSTICPGQSVVLSGSTAVQTMGGANSITYSWTPVTYLNPGTGYSQSVTASPTVTTVYTLQASNPYGCVATGSITVPVNAFPTLTPIYWPAQAVCPGFTSTLTAQGAISYTWTGNTFTNSIIQASISVGPGSYTVVGSNGGSCLTTSIFPVTTANPLTITVAPPSATTCIESNFPKYSQPVHLTATGASFFTWIPYDPLHMTYSIGPQTDVRPAASTCYTVIGSTQVCSGTTQVCVNVIPQFNMTVTPNDPAICLGDSTELKIASIGSGAVGPISAYTYSWTEALNAPPISLTEYFEPKTMAFPQNTTTYTLEMKDYRQCMSFPKLVTVTVLPRPATAVAIPTINNVATNTVCFVGLNPGAPDVTINLIAYNTNAGLPTGIVPSYTWISPFMPTYNSILTNAEAGSVIVKAPVREFKGSAVAIYTVVSGYVSPSKGCRRIDTVSVRTIDCRSVKNVYFNTVQPNDTICTRNCITFVNNTDTAAGGPQQLYWQFEGGSPATSTLQSPTVCYNLPHEGKGFDVILKVGNQYPILDGGSAVAKGISGYVKVVDVPNVTIIAPGRVRSDTTVRFGKSVDLEGSGALTYSWSPGYNITSLTNPKVKVNPFKTTQYILTGYNSKNCFSNDTLNVIVVEDCGEMYVPNAFTPNNDGANDVLYVRGICLQSLTFMVFNRWGEKVFETTEQKDGWDGTYKGELMNTGVFVFRLEGRTYDGKSFSMKGNVTLIR